MKPSGLESSKNFNRYFPGESHTTKFNIIKIYLNAQLMDYKNSSTIKFVSYVKIYKTKIR